MNIIRPLTSGDCYSIPLKKIADELLSHQAQNNRLEAAVTELYSLCSSVTGINERSTYANDLDEIRLPNGEAISPKDAARCVLDYNRTSKFLRGLYAAIIEAQKRFPDKMIEILYAGCGPFAALAIPLTARFNAAEIRFTLLDVHKRSLNAARHIFQTFEKSAFVRDYIQCDAAEYQHDAPHVIHIVIVEAMQAALEKEPQAAITMNLAPQLCPGGFFLPERITVDCCLCDLTKEFPSLIVEMDVADSLLTGSSGKDRINLGRVFDLSVENYRSLPSLASGAENGGLLFTRKRLLSVPDDLNGEFNMMLLTNITVFNSIALIESESGLTCPKILFDAGKARRGNIIEFEYQLGDKPGFKCRFL
jgi:hypothetical protein